MHGRDRWRFRRVPDRHAHQPVLEAAQMAAGGDRHAAHAGRACPRPRPRTAARAFPGWISQPHGGAILAQLRPSPSLRDRSRSRAPAGVEGVSIRPSPATATSASGTRPISSAPASTRASTTTCRRSGSGLPGGWCRHEDARRRRREGSIWRAMTVKTRRDMARVTQKSPTHKIPLLILRLFASTAPIHIARVSNGRPAKCAVWCRSSAGRSRVSTFAHSD